MTVGTYCYAANCGLGIQCRSFIDHGVIQKIYFAQHPEYPNHPEWYTKEQILKHSDDLLKCDVLFFFETPFDWGLLARARGLGIKTILMPMYECTRFPFPYQPDEIIGGSAMEPILYGRGVHINAPVEVPWKLRTRAKVFIHNAGHGGIYGRNSTREILHAMRYVESPIKLIVRSQGKEYQSTDPRVEIVHGDVPYEELFKEGDVLLLPEKFGGSFLPMQEAFASGMMVMATNRFPTDTWLPKEPLIPPIGFHPLRYGSLFTCAEVSSRLIAKKIDEWYDKDITQYSMAGKKWAEENSWKALKPKFMKIINS